MLRSAEANIPLTLRDHGILYNLTLRAYARAEAYSDVLRLRDEIVDRGLPIDRFTLGPIQQALEELDLIGVDDHRLRGSGTGLWEELGVLLDDVVHELTTPTVRLGGVSKAIRIRAQALGDATLSESVEQLMAAADALNDRLSEYAVLAQADPERAQFDVRDVFQWVVARTERQAATAGVTVQWSAASRDSEQGLRLRGQPVFFRIAIKALVSNAIEALSAPETPASKRRIWLSAMHTNAHPSAGWIDVFVRDNGPGIADEVRELVFRRGFTTKRGRGLGLGLTLVESVVELFGGSVSLNDSSSGAEFFLRFPAAPLDADDERDLHAMEAFR